MKMHYSIRGQLGAGGSGTVYKIWDYNLERHCAMKQIKGQCKTEAMCLNELDHPMLPKVICAEYKSGNTYIIMEYIEGITLTKYLEEKGPLNQEKAVKYILSILEVLEYLHQQRPSLVYGDLKTDNIMVKLDGNLKLIDFGSMITYRDYRKREDKRYATRGFASPEVYNRNLEIDSRSDLYAAGAVLFFMLTGIDPSKPPYEIIKIRRCNPCLSIKLENIIERSTHQDREKRYQACSEFILELKGYKRIDEISRKRMLLARFFCLFLIFLEIILILKGFYFLEKRNYETALFYLIAGGNLSLFVIFLKKIVWHNNSVLFPVKTVKNIFLTEKKGRSISDDCYP